MPADRCTAHYERPGGRQPGDRSVKCHLEAGHPGEHEEEGTEVTWLPDEPDDHTRFREQALADPETREAYIRAQVDAAYQRGLAEGRRQVLRSELATDETTAGALDHLPGQESTAAFYRLHAEHIRALLEREAQGLVGPWETAERPEEAK